MAVRVNERRQAELAERGRLEERAREAERRRDRIVEEIVRLRGLRAPAAAVAELELDRGATEAELLRLRRALGLLGGTSGVEPHGDVPSGGGRTVQA